MKKILLTSSAALITAALAAPSAMAEGKTGFNVGLMGGYTTSSTKADRQYVNTGTNTDTGQGVNSSDLGGGGGLFGLQVGYDYVFSNMGVVGLDVFGMWNGHRGDTSSANIPGTAGDLKHQMKMKYSFGVAAKFGYFFKKDTLGFIRIGYINSKFENSTSLTLGGQTGTVTDKKNHSGFLIGVGVDLPVTDRVTVGIEYDYAAYQKKTVRGTIPALPAATTDVLHSIKPRMHMAMVNVKWRF